MEGHQNAGDGQEYELREKVAANSTDQAAEDPAHWQRRECLLDGEYRARASGVGM